MFGLKTLCARSRPTTGADRPQEPTGAVQRTSYGERRRARGHYHRVRTVRSVMPPGTLIRTAKSSAVPPQERVVSRTEGLRGCGAESTPASPSACTGPTQCRALELRDCLVISRTDRLRSAAPHPAAYHRPGSVPLTPAPHHVRDLGRLLLGQRPIFNYILFGGPPGAGI